MQVQFDRQQRIAVARIIYDLIEADMVLDNEELAYFENASGLFRITREMLVEAKRKELSWAINVLKQLDAEQLGKVKQMLIGLALSDGSCVPQEALLIIAIKYALEGRGEVFSVPAISDYAEGMNVVFVENGSDPKVDAYLSSNLRYIRNELQLAGFSFIYIPEIASDYREMDQAYLHKVISYLIPSIPEERVDDVQRDLCSMTTPRFCSEILNAKMGLPVLGNKPSLLIKIGDSYVCGKYSQADDERSTVFNFLRVDLEGDILGTILTLVDDYRSFVSCNLVSEIRPQAKKFIYSGFHRSLFDLIAYGKKSSDYMLLINVNSNSLTFRCIDNPSISKDLKMTPLASSLYILMVHQSLFSNGLDWRENPGSIDKKEILGKFGTIYSSICDRECPPEYKDRVLASRIKSSIKALTSEISNIYAFIPEQKVVDGKSLYMVPVPPHLIYVVDHGEEIPMIQSTFWKDL